jgi:hypothetical protein
MTIDLLDVIKNLNSNDESSPMEKALSETLLFLSKEIVKRTILPKRAIKNLALLNNDIFFHEIILDYKENLKDTKRIIKIYQSLIKSIANGIQNQENKKLAFLHRNKRDYL